MNPGDIFNTFLLAPGINLLVFIIRLLEASQIPWALGFSIIILTIFIRLVLWPVTAKQMHSMSKMNELKPHLEELKKKHKDDKAALAKAQMELYKEHGVNPAGGCLPAIIQILLILPLYQIFNAFFSGEQGLGTVNHFLYFPEWRLTQLRNPYFLGINLALKPSDFFAHGVYLLAIPPITGTFQLVLSKMMYPAPVKKYPSDSPKEKHEKEDMEEAMQSMQGQMMVLMPVMIAFFAYSLPVGLALYWNALNVVSMVQQYQITGWGGLAPWLNKIPGVKVSEEPHLVSSGRGKTKVKIEYLEKK